MMTPTYPTVAIVGPGAIGTTVATALHEVERTPMLCGRTPRESSTLRDADGVVVVPGPVRTDPRQADRSVDLVFLAVESTQVEAAAPWLEALCRSDTIVCVLPNGAEQESTTRPTWEHPFSPTVRPVGRSNGISAPVSSCAGVGPMACRCRSATWWCRCWLARATDPADRSRTAG